MALRVGFIGLGRIFALHLRGYRDDPRVQLVAGLDPSPEARAAAGRLAPELRLHDELDAFLAERLDLVEVLSPHPLHATHAIAAMRAGAHVSVQKPMAMSLEEADAMITVAKETGRILRVFENYRFYEPLRRLKRLLDDGVIGNPLSMRLRTCVGNLQRAWNVPAATWRWRAELFEQTGLGRLTFDDGHHRLATALWLLGPVESVMARVDSTDTPTGPIDAPASVMWRHRDPKVHVIWDVTYAPDMTIRTDYYALDERFELTGTRGILRLNRATGRMLDEPVLQLYRDSRLESFTDMEEDWGASFAACTRHLVDVIVDGGEPILDPMDGRAALALAIATRDASRAGLAVTPAEPSVAVST